MKHLWIVEKYSFPKQDWFPVAVVSFKTKKDFLNMSLTVLTKILNQVYWVQKLNIDQLNTIQENDYE